MSAAIPRHSRSLVQTLAFLVVAFALQPGLAHAGAPLDVTRMTLDVIQQRDVGVTQDFAIELVVEGSGLINGTIQTPPAPPQFPSGELLLLEDDEGDLIFEAGGFQSLNALQQRFANGTYTVTVNGNSIGLPFDQVFPNGAATVTLPAHNAMIPNGQPTITYTDACTNCNAQEARIEDGANQIELVLQTLPPETLRSSIQFSEFPANLGGAGAISELPQDTPLEFCIVTFVLTQTDLVLGAVDDFEYRAVTGIDDLIGFTPVASGQIVSDIDEIFIEYLGNIGGTFSIELGAEGSGLASGTFVAPNQAPVALTLFGNAVEFSVDGFADEAAVRAAFPPTDGTSKYVFSIDGGQKFFSADFMPGSPDGNVQITSPSDGANVSSTPTVTLSNTCTNCDFQFVEIEDELSFGGDIGLNADSASPPFPTTLQVPADFNNEDGAAGEITELPDGGYFTFAGIGLGGATMESTTPADSFELFLGSSVEDTLTFTVPEPSATLAASVALATCAALVAVDRRRRTT